MDTQNKENTKESQTKSKLNMEIDLSGVSQVDILLFTKHLSITLKSGLTLTESLDILREQAKGKMKKTLNTILSKVSSGEPFYKAITNFPKYFSPVYINMAKSGELSGNLEENLNKLSSQLNKRLALKKKMKAAMIYPSMVFIAIFGLGMAVALFVLPKILPLFRTLDVDLPLTTRGLLFVAEVFEKHGFSILIGTIVLIVFLIWFLRRNFIKPFIHKLILKLPVIKHIIKNINLDKFTHTLGSLLDSGLTIDTSLQITADSTENRVYKKAILEIIPKIQSGESLSQALREYEDLFPVITSRMVGVGERTGNLDSTLKYLSEFYEEAIDETMKNLSNILEPVLLIFIGLVVGVVAISILGPIYQITGNLR